MKQKMGAVVIGRNEGARLEQCLTSLQGALQPIVYVDSGSTDASIEVARAADAAVVELDLSIPFTAARARNVGAQQLIKLAEDTKYIQFLDGDCEIVAGWINAAHTALEADGGLALVCGRRRERHPDASLWNKLVDAEWDTPIGETTECGGDALIRHDAFEAVGGFRADMIAGEEPEMCFRMRTKGWRIRRLDAEMTLHDAAMTRFGQWWQRCRRAGYAYALGAMLHGSSAEKYRLSETRRALIWGGALPFAVCIGSLAVSPWMLLLFLVVPLQVLRMRWKTYPWVEALFLTLSKFPEAQGVLECAMDRWAGKRRGLIEYK